MRTIGLFLWVIVIIGCASNPPLPEDDVSYVHPAFPVCSEHCFDRDAATRALDRAVVEIQTCESDSEKSGTATITFEPSGRVSKVVLDAHLERSSAADCIIAAFRKCVVPEFREPAQIVGKVFSIRGNTDGGA